MAEKHYLFQKNTGEWVFGPTTNSVMPSGLLRLAEVSETNINLRWVHNRDIAYRYGELAYGDFLQENGTAYASLAAFVAATKGFFAGKISATLETGDIQIGAVELKNADTDDRAKIGTGSAMATSDKALAVADPVVKGALTDGTQKTKNVDASGVATEAIYRTFSKTVTRPANTTAYTAADVIGDVSEALDSFADVAKAAGYGVCITNVRIYTTDTGLSGKTIRVHFLSDTDTAIADNAAFAIGDGTKRRGYIDVVMGTGNLAKEGQAQGENLLINPVARAVPFILETTEGFTPSGNSTTLRVEIGCILSN